MILVTGGTGLVGIHLLMELSKANELPIRAIYRSLFNKAKAEQIFKTINPNANFLEHWKRIEWVESDITEIPSLKIAFDGVTQVYHCAGLISWNISDFEKLKKVNIEGTANMINFSVNGGVEKFCHVSSIATLNLNIGEQVYSEASQWNPEMNNSVYAISKFGAEMEVQRGMQEGLNAVIVNPGVIIGSGFFESGSGKLFKKVAKGVPFYTPGKTGYIGVWDTVKIMHALMQANEFNERFILVAENLTAKYVLEVIANTIGAKPPKKLILRKWVVAYAYFQHVLSKVSKLNPSIPIELINSLYAISIYDNSKVKSVLNWEFEDIEKVINRTGDQFVEKLKTNKKYA